jgi:hypothetical protein
VSLNYEISRRTTASRKSFVWRAKKIQNRRVKFWELIADKLSKAGWSWGCVSAIDSNGRTIWIADAHRGDGKRFVVRADERLPAFAELESAILLRGGLSLQAGQIFSKLDTVNGFESGGGHFPR